MAEDKNTGPRELEKLALIAESVQSMFSGKGTIIFELPKGEYASVINHFREIDRSHEQFSIDISGTEFHFILMDSNKS
tara:strand:- start:542 stop:775 length:234 start_codon:yes stop_codon:yes gene_type:complete